MPMPKTLPNQQLKKLLRRQREEFGLTQEQMAHRLTELGLPASGASVSRWEAEGVVPAIKEAAYAEILAKAYRLSITQLYIVAGLSVRTAVAEEDTVISDELMHYLHMATGDQLKLITRLAKQVVYPDPD